MIEIQEVIQVKSEPTEKHAEGQLGPRHQEATDHVRYQTTAMNKQEQPQAEDY